MFDRSSQVVWPRSDGCHNMRFQNISKLHSGIFYLNIGPIDFWSSSLLLACICKLVSTLSVISLFTNAKNLFTGVDGGDICRHWHGSQHVSAEDWNSHVIGGLTKSDGCCQQLSYAMWDCVCVSCVILNQSLMTIHVSIAALFSTLSKIQPVTSAKLHPNVYVPVLNAAISM